MIGYLLRYVALVAFFASIDGARGWAQTQGHNAPIANDYVAVWTSPAPTQETGGPVSMIQLPSGRLIVTFTNWRRVDGKQVTTDKVYYFTPLFGIWSLFAAYLIVSRKAQFLFVLAVGPLLTLLVYLAEYGTVDPSWYSLLALLGIGMLVSSVVTALWVALTVTPQMEQ